MAELINKTSVKINKNPKNRTSFAAETPLQKMEAEAKKIVSYMAGKYVEGDCIEGLLVCLAKRNGVSFYVILDKDRNVVLTTVSQELKPIKGHTPADFSILDWLKWHDIESLIAKVKEGLEKEMAAAISPITINWKRQFGPKDEKPAKKNNQKSNKAKK